MMNPQSYKDLKKFISKIDPNCDCDALHTALVELGTNSLGRHPALLVARARFRAIDERRARQKQQAEYLAKCSIPKEVPDPAELVIQAERFEYIRRAVHDLKEPYRKVVHLRFWDGLSPHEIANRLRLPIQTVYTKLRRAFKQLTANPVFKDAQDE